MDSILTWGADLIAAVQSWRSPALDLAVRAVTELGSEYFFLVAVPLLFWCVDERRAVRLGFLSFFSLFANLAVKDLVALPRPYESRPGIFVVKERGFSLPSWHAQGSATFWGYMIGWIKGPIGLIAGILLPLLIGFTRVYLGVHYPSDVIAGWVIGAIIVAGYRLLEPRLLPLLSKLTTRFQIMIIAGVSWLMAIAHMSDVGPAAGFFGMGLGWALNVKRLRCSAEGKLGARLPRVLVGGVPLMALYLGLKYLFAGEWAADFGFYGALRSMLADQERLLRFLRYALVGFWASFGAPWVFLRLKIAGRRPDEGADAVQA